MSGWSQNLESVFKAHNNLEPSHLSHKFSQPVIFMYFYLLAKESHIYGLKHKQYYRRYNEKQSPALLLPTADFCSPEATTTFSSWLLLLLTVVLLNKCLLHNFLSSAKLDMTYGLSTSKAEDLVLVLHPPTHTMLSPPPSSQSRKPSLTQYSEFGLWLCRILYIHLLTCTLLFFFSRVKNCVFYSAWFSRTYHKFTPRFWQGWWPPRIT